MGNISRDNRCERFRDRLEHKILNRASMKPGDWLEVRNVAVGLDKSSNVSRLYVLIKNQRTGDEEELMVEQVLFDPDGHDEANVERLHNHLFYDQGYKTEHKANRKKIIGMLKKAGLIDSEYKETWP